MKADRVVSALERGAMLVSNVMLLAILFVSTADVLLRYVFNSPLSWSYDLISLYLMPGVFFFAAADTLRANEHVCVDLLHTRMRPRQRHIAFAVCMSLAFLACALMSDAAWSRFADSWRNHDVVAGAIEWPTWIPALFVLVGLLMLSVRLLLRAIGHALSAFAGRNVIALPPISGAQEAV